MSPIDITAIERHARKLRAAEMRRLEKLVAERMGLMALLAGRSVLGALETVAEALRPLFSWNPKRLKY